MSDPVWWYWDSTIDYVIVTETYWDDTVGDTVSNSHIRITGVEIETSVMYHMTTSENHTDSISLVGSSHTKNNTVFVEIPETIEDIPVTEIGKMHVSCSKISDPSGMVENFWSACVVVPNTLSAIGDIRCSSDFVKIEYDGTCEQYLSQCKVYTDTPVRCTDGRFYGNDITYSGTCAQWKSFCPDYLSTTNVMIFTRLILQIQQLRKRLLPPLHALPRLLLRIQQHRAPQRKRLPPLSQLRCHSQR